MSIYLNLFANMNIKALVRCLKCTQTCSAELQEGDPIEYKNFVAAITRVLEYAQIVLTLGAFWIGLRFKFPLIWLLLEEYQPDYWLCDYEEESWPHELIANQGFRSLGDDTAGAYNFTDFHWEHSKRN